MKTGQLSTAPPREVPRGGTAWLAAGLLASLVGCAARPEVQMLATGRADVSAYALNGNDLDLLRQEARRLCPLGGEVLRQSTQGVMAPARADSRWQRALQISTGWLELPPERTAQMVVVCREAGDRMRLEPAARAADPAAAAAAPPADAASAADPVLSASLPVGPITPEW